MAIEPEPNKGRGIGIGEIDFAENLEGVGGDLFGVGNDAVNYFDAVDVGGVLFRARATVFVPASVKLGTIRGDLEKIATDLMVDLKLAPVEA